MKNFNIVLKLIKLLSDNKIYSNYELSCLFGLNLLDINQYIQILKNFGLNIDTSISNRCRLLDYLVLLNKKKIISKINNSNLLVVPVVDSTNNYLLHNINKLNFGHVCISEYQYSGRGRCGRKWFSPFGLNLYMSMYWKLKKSPSTITSISLVVAIVIAEILQSLGIKKIKLKWPNDIYLNNCKLAGILVELINKIGNEYCIIIGIGINLFMHSIKTVYINSNWISLKNLNINIDRDNLASIIINSLYKELQLFESEGLKPFMTRWFVLDYFVNRQIKLVIGNKEIHGISRGIDNQGALLLDQYGQIKSCVIGEMSIKAF